jgi:hypothetical protein
MTDSLVHQFAHALPFERQPVQSDGHGNQFQRALLVVAAYYYGDSTKYGWHTEYKNVRTSRHCMLSGIACDQCNCLMVPSDMVTCPVTARNYAVALRARRIITDSNTFRAASRRDSVGGSCSTLPCRKHEHRPSMWATDPAIDRTQHSWWNADGANNTPTPFISTDSPHHAHTGRVSITFSCESQPTICSSHSANPARTSSRARALSNKRATHQKPPTNDANKDYPT